METVLSQRTYLTEAGFVVVCLLCEDLFASLWSLVFFLHFDCKGSENVGDKQINLNENNNNNIYTFLHIISIILIISQLQYVYSLIRFVNLYIANR